MKVTTPEISWHERDPIYSVDFQPGNRKIKRIATTGVDKFVRVRDILVLVLRMLIIIYLC
jgi:chromatin assembly factor 1 subunit B